MGVPLSRSEKSPNRKGFQYVVHEIENAIIALMAARKFISDLKGLDLNVKVKDIMSFDESFLGKDTRANIRAESE